LKKSAQEPTLDRSGKAKGFTLIELLVVISIIVILAIILLVAINPFQAQAKARDAVRVQDLNNLRDAINLGVTQNSSSIPAFLCYSATPPATLPCSGNSGSGSNATDGTGWLPVNLKSIDTVTMTALPKDPTNTGSEVYSYKTNGTGTAYEIDAVLEASSNSNTMANDGGTNPAAYEVGTDLSILP
jgi:prepilin-type N-terminal cleavage/methylation domain-containing protein